MEPTWIKKSPRQAGFFVEQKYSDRNGYYVLKIPLTHRRRDSSGA